MSSACPQREVLSNWVHFWVQIYLRSVARPHTHCQRCLSSQLPLRHTDINYHCVDVTAESRGLQPLALQKNNTSKSTFDMTALGGKKEWSLGYIKRKKTTPFWTPLTEFVSETFWSEGLWMLEINSAEIYSVPNFFTYLQL